jgi:hypothetical protein
MIGGINAKIVCAEESMNRREAIFGTAPLAHSWLLLEYRGPWQSDAFAGSEISKEVKKHLGCLLRRIPRVRFGFIKRLDAFTPPYV